MQQQLQPRPRLPGEEGEVSDEELVKRLRPLSWSDIDARFGVPMDETMREAADRIKALTAERDEYWKSFVHWRKEADTLTEQLEAARADAKEAEAYAEELAKDQVDLCSQLIAAEDKLAKAVELLRKHCDPMDMSDADLAVLAEIESSTPYGLEGGKDD
jgi:DNA repair ATPase RecN